MKHLGVVVLIVLSSMLNGGMAQKVDMPAVTQENEYRCKADTLKYYDNYLQLAERLPYSELEKRSRRMNECGWLFGQLVLQKRDYSDELTLIDAKANIVQVLFETQMNQRLRTYLMGLGKLADFLLADERAHPGIAEKEQRKEVVVDR